MKRLNNGLDWIMTHKGKSLLIVALVALACILAYFLLWYVIFPVLGVAFVIWMFLGFPMPTFQKTEPIPPLENVYGILMGWMYTVTVLLFRSNALPSPIREPTGISEVYGSPPMVKIKGINRLQVYIPLRMDQLDAELDLDDTKAVLQAGIDNQLAEGNLPDQPHNPGPDDMPVPVTGFAGVSLLHIAEIKRERLRLVVTAFWVNNRRAAFRVKLFHRKPPGGGGGGSVDSTDRDY